MSLTRWEGKKVKQAVKAAAISAVDETMGNCVALAMQKARVDTGYLKNRNEIIQEATDTGDGVEGKWGNMAEYAIYQELGPDPSNPHPWAYTPFLRPAADEEYPKLAQRIKDRT